MLLFCFIFFCLMYFSWSIGKLLFDRMLSIVLMEYRIVIVEDNVIVRMIFCGYLLFIGYLNVCSFVLGVELKSVLCK